MKSSEEMMNSLLERRNEYERLRRDQRRKMIRIAAPALALCLVLLTGVIVWRSSSGRSSGETADGSGGTSLLQPPESNVVKITGEKISEEEAAAYLKENYTSIVSALTASGVQTEGLRFSEKGYSHILYEGGGKALELHQDFRNYLAYSGDKLVAILTLTKENGRISSTPAFGGEWFGSYSEFLKKHAGERLLFLYYGIAEVVLLPDGSAVSPIGYSVSQYFEWVKDPYEWFDQDGAEAAVYVP